ncbi:hypothetical protein, partial [Dyadobacter diqingensis]|uniref:hypothetical protein n=1 Tax=Dyadobacter diqingensis TaxID=2938121 RepID=UPI0020C1A606
VFRKVFLAVAGVDRWDKGNSLKRLGAQGQCAVDSGLGVGIVQEDLGDGAGQAFLLKKCDTIYRMLALMRSETASTQS